MVRNCTKRLLLAMMVFTLLLGAASFVQATPGQAAETVVPVYGAPAYLDGSPIGGGDGYSQIYSAADADYVVDTATELKSALASATSGQIVYAADGATISLNSESDWYGAIGGSGGNYAGFYVKAGVILAGGRGTAGVTAGIIQLASGFNNGADATLILCGTGADVTGLTIVGPQDETSGSNHWSAIEAKGNSEIHNNEIHGFGYTGVYVGPNTNDVWIHHNYIHHMQSTDCGYGVCIDRDTYPAIVEGNIFEYCKHFVAGAAGLSSYVFRYNYLGAKLDLGGQIDCHGGNDSGTSTPAGGSIEIYNNTSINQGVWFVQIRGIPNTLVSVHNNWTYLSEDYSDWGGSEWGSAGPIGEIMTSVPGYGYNAPNEGAYVRMEAYDNWYGTTPPPGVSAYSATTTSSTSFQPSLFISNSAPTSPVAPSGMTAGLTSTEYKYSAMATDPDADALIYLFFWGDGTFSATAQVDSGVTAATTHAWSQPGTYAVYVKAADANGAVSAPSYALSVKVLSPLQSAATQESSRAVGTPSDGSSTGPSDAVDGDASGSPSHGSLDSQGSPLVPAHGSGFVWRLFSVSVIMGAAVLLIGAIVRDTISEPPGW